MGFPYTQIIPGNEHLIQTENLFADCVLNLVEILKRKQRDKSIEQKLSYIRRLTNVYDDELIIVPSTPCISVVFNDFEEEIHTIGNRCVTIEFKIRLEVFYYHGEVKNNIRKKEIRDALWEISRFIRENSGLNGLSSKGALIKRGTHAYRPRNNIIYEGALIDMEVPILAKTDRKTT